MNNHEGTPEIVCPHCGYHYMDSWDFSLDRGETECVECDKPFAWFRDVIIEYSTKPL